jgi:cytochrome c oxidase subunit 2
MGYLNEVLRRLLLLPPQASTLAGPIDWLHYAVILSTMVGAVALAVVGIVFCVRYREPSNRRHGERRKQAPTLFLWAELTVIFGLFGLFVAFWIVGYWQYVKIVSPPADAYDVYVTGKQWMWKFAYPDGSHSANTLYVPAGKPVRLILTSRDVIHSFFVPDFRVKHDAVPGRYTSLWFTAKEPGSHHIFCAEFCGTWHSRMMGDVVALSAVDFERWLQGGERERDFPLDPDLPLASAADTSLVTQGQNVAAKYGCLRCHSVDGSPHIGPTWVGLYDSQVPLATGGSVVADVAYLTESMMEPNTKLHAGYSTVMPSYFGTMQPGEVGAVVSYIKSLQENGRQP